MSIWKSLMYRFEKEETKNWSSLQKTSYLLLPLLIYLLVHDLAEILLWAGLEGVLYLGGEALQQLFAVHVATLQGILNGLAILIGVAAIYSGLKAEIVPKTEKKADKWIDERWISTYCFLAAFAFLTAIGVNILFYQLGIAESSESFGQVRESQFSVSFMVGLILYGIISPIAEEAVFRGLIYNRMKRCFSYGIALVISSLLFGCYHGNLVQAVYGTLLGLLIAYAYELYQSFAAPVIFHSVANISVYTMTYHEDLRKLGRLEAMTIAIVMLLAAMVILLYIRNAMKNKV